MKTYGIAVIGYGRTGRGWAEAFAESDRWEVAYICDLDPGALEQAGKDHPRAKTVDDMAVLFADKRVNAVCLCTLADARPEQIRKAVETGKHILAEKPLAPDVATEEQLLEEIEAGDVLVAVNLFNRNAWYHKEAQRLIASGEIGKLGIIRIGHLTADRIMPGTTIHFPEGPPFHNCGMHYVDVARWYAGSEYEKWHCQGVRMWGEPVPWWVTVHGTFQNGVAFEITQGFVYGQMAKDKTNNSYCECIGTKGLVRTSHDFREATLEMHGVTNTICKKAPCGGKQRDVMIRLFTESLDAGKDMGLPSARDAVIASRISQEMLESAAAQNPPTIGTQEEMEEIIRFKQSRERG